MGGLRLNYPKLIINQGWIRGINGSWEDVDWCDRRENWDGCENDREEYITNPESARTEEFLAKILNKVERFDMI